MRWLSLSDMQFLQWATLRYGFLTYTEQIRAKLSPVIQSGMLSQNHCRLPSSPPLTLSILHSNSLLSVTPIYLIKHLQ